MTIGFVGLSKFHTPTLESNEEDAMWRESDVQLKLVILPECLDNAKDFIFWKKQYMYIRNAAGEPSRSPSLFIYLFTYSFINTVASLAIIKIVKIKKLFFRGPCS